MKSAISLLFASTLCTATFAEEFFLDESSFPETISCENGNVLIANVGNYSVTPATWTKLSTNSNYTVVCQIVYENTSFEKGPSTPEEIIRTRQLEKCLNLGLTKFLREKCEGKSDREIVRSYRTGTIRGKVEDDFSNWFDDNVRDILKVYGKDANVVIWKVSMRAVGPLADALDAS